MNELSRLKSINWLRWSARAISTLAAAFISIMGIGYACTESGPVTLESVMVEVTFTGFVIAVVISWWREKTGAILLIIWSVLFMIYMYTVVERNAVRVMLIIAGPFLVSGILFLLGRLNAKRFRKLVG